ncbi:unnamed protein product [Paramecium pentaurelia]|uniref:Uncharacterized protein n=1 Tax=Paramecium pentaurelia TaxID=43138 RepID=A0A8S1UBU5_9CILI|nr:unnamed protein product [Paramecium pentaurelia]
MSQFQTLNLKVSNETKSVIQKSILKNPQRCSNQSKIRLDWAGNQVVKGGLHKIVFINQDETARTFMDILTNDFTDSCEEIVHKKKKNFNQEQAENYIKNQCEQCQQSNCCFIQ